MQGDHGRCPGEGMPKKTLSSRQHRRAQKSFTEEEKGIHDNYDRISVFVGRIRVVQKVQTVEQGTD